MAPNPADGHRDPSETIRRIPADPELARYSGLSCGGLSAARGEL